MEPGGRVPCQALTLIVLDYSPLFQDHHLVTAVEGRQPVRYDDHCAALDQPVHGSLDQPLGTGVYTRRRLVEHYDVRVTQEDAGECQ